MTAAIEFCARFDRAWQNAYLFPHVETWPSG